MKRLAIFLAFLIGVAQIPWAATVCLCRDHSAERVEKSCHKPQPTHCGSCKTQDLRTCMVKKGEHFSDSVLNLDSLEIPFAVTGVLSPAFDQSEVLAVATIREPDNHIREPDVGCHQLRAPPITR